MKVKRCSFTRVVVVDSHVVVMETERNLTTLMGGRKARREGGGGRVGEKDGRGREQGREGEKARMGEGE